MEKNQDSQRGLMTISPPSKVNTDTTHAQILASGLDSLNLAIDVHWADSELFDYLNHLKDIAKSTRNETPGFFVYGENKIKWQFTLKPHGSKGYEWLIQNKEFTLLIGSWKTPQSKPSIMAEIRSETLWHLGAKSAVEMIILILISQGGTKISLKPSRADLCVDVLLLEKFWNMELLKYAVTRSTYMAPHFNHRKMTGLSIGKGKISARLYDKPLEIRQVSKKLWMYDIWRIKEVPENRKIIRVEFQLRRELLTQLAIKDIDNLFEYLGNLWSYCSQRWLKFQTNPGKHHTQRQDLPWWKIVQNGFEGAQGKNPLIRSKAAGFDISQNFAQSIGHIRALIAGLIAGHYLDEYVPAEIEWGLNFIARKVNETEEQQDEFSASVKEKLAKIHRSISRHVEAESRRKELNLPTTL